MFFRNLLLRRELHPQSVLETVAADPGMTALYYANRYFGGRKNVMPVTHILWNQLKRSGKVYMQRSQGPEAAALWFPTLGAPRPHHVRHHCPEEEDLSVLQSAAAAGSATEPAAPDTAKPKDEASDFEIESAIVRLVEATPGKDIHFYVNELPLDMQKRAPAAFKRLREASLLERTTTPSGTFVWS